MKRNKIVTRRIGKVEDAIADLYKQIRGQTPQDYLKNLKKNKNYSRINQFFFEVEATYGALQFLENRIRKNQALVWVKQSPESAIFEPHLALSSDLTQKIPEEDRKGPPFFIRGALEPAELDGKLDGGSDISTNADLFEFMD